MDKLKHWTNRSEDDFLHAIASDFVAQIETRMEDENLERKDLATKAYVSPGRVSQVLNDPSSLSLRSVVKYTRALNMKVAIVTYDDRDPANEVGPIDAGVFASAWQRAGCPRDLFEVRGFPNETAVDTRIMQRLYFTEDTSPNTVQIENIGRKGFSPTQVLSQRLESTKKIQQGVINAEEIIQ